MQQKQTKYVKWYCTCSMRFLTKHRNIFIDSKYFKRTDNISKIIKKKALIQLLFKKKNNKNEKINIQ